MQKLRAVQFVNAQMRYMPRLYKTIPFFLMEILLSCGTKDFVPGMLNVFLCMYIS